MRSAGRAPDVVINCAAWTNVDGAESEPEQAAAVNGAGAGNRRRRGDVAGRLARPHLHRLRVQRGQAVAVRGVRPGRHRSRPMAAPSSTASGRWRGGARPHTIVRTAWLFGAGGHCFPKTILRAGVRAPRADRGLRPDRLPDVHRPPRHGARGPGRAAHARVSCTSPAAASAPGTSSLPRSWRAAGMDCPVRPIPTSEYPLPARASGQQRPDLSERGAPVLPDWRAGLEQFMSELTGVGV